MAHQLLASLSICSFSTSLRTSMAPFSARKSANTSTGLVVRAVQSIETTHEPGINAGNITRRSAEYKHTIWTFDDIQSLRNDYAGESYKRRANKLKEQVRVMLMEEADQLAQLNLIDVLQRLGLSYHFEDQIQSILKPMQYNIEWTINDNNLYATALQFRLLRQHGYWIPQEVFNGFKDEAGKFKASLSEDIEGILSLYEASYHSIEDESVLDEARDFTIKNLKEYIQQQHKKDENLAIFARHALELPLHWRTERLETRWFINAYEKKKDMNHILLELAKLDFNIVQSVHQEDLKLEYRWWRSTGIVERMTFARDRLVENFLWSTGMIFEPQFEFCRRMTSRNISLLTTIDDMYDVFGRLDELELFTNAVERWDVNTMDQLPDYMKFCFLALHNSINEMAFDVLKQNGFHIIKYLKKVWADLCKAYLVEAKWYHSGYTPTLQEYIENAWITVTAPLILMHVYFFVTNSITEEALQCLEEYRGIIRTTSIIFRLEDDLGTSSYELKRGDVLKAVQCYMHETGASEESAREHIKFLIYETWKKMNKEAYHAKSPFSKTFIRCAMDVTKMAHSFYLYGDGYGVQDCDTKENISAILIRPIPI
ncbi:hypothetical protein FNV43_RR27150 [Rhamnella rubrinervis]|uniref:Uncharacterized protein n=1 Tax=Rhamnella rubrinervis TaxID=2594499 RepID=A0A8K0DK23_9ROSA|nr:hypothetical protein FNV43_RR27150 [Rhamnella rubrinervis]